MRALSFDILADVLAESRDLLDDAEAALVELESRPVDPALRSEVNRCLHSMKGMVGYVRMGAVADLCHTLESLKLAIPEAEPDDRQAAFDLVLQSVDSLRGYFDSCPAHLDQTSVLAVDTTELRLLTGRAVELAKAIGRGTAIH